VASGVTNWHEYACYVIERARLKSEDGSVFIAGQKRQIRVLPENIQPIPSTEFPTPAKRPANSRLDTGKLRQTFGLNLPSWQNGVNHIVDQIL
jgi:dTDP-4-dehydrorhamnose reductase